jgi:hypothetical protein
MYPAVRALACLLTPADPPVAPLRRPAHTAGPPRRRRSVHLRYWRFITIWSIYAAGVAYHVRLAMQKPLENRCETASEL